MARPRKEGLDYFPLDVNLDYKWEAVEACHGLAGFAVCIKLIQECFKSDSGEIDFSGVIRRRTIEKRLNISEELLNNILETAAEIELFDKKAYKERKIITSSGIKKRIDIVSNDRKNARKRSERSYSTEELPNNDRRTPEKVHKEKKRKEKNIREWRENFEEYKKLVNDTFEELIADSTEVKKQQSFYPNVDIVKSLEKAIHNFWGTEAGWKNKKSKRSKTINMRSTLINAISKDKVYIPRDEQQSSGKTYLDTIQFTDTRNLYDY